MNAAIAQFLDSFSNRDIAIWVWSIAFIAYLFVNKKFRGSLLRIIKSLLNIKLMIPIVGGLTIIVVVTYVLWKLNLWNVSILKDTIVYFFTANVVLFRYVGSNNRNFMEDALANVNPDHLDETTKAIYDEINESVNSEYLASLYQEAYKNYNNGNYAQAIPDFEKIVQMDESYRDGNAIYYLAQSYRKNNDEENAKTYYQKVVDLYPNTERASTAQKYLNQMGADTETEE